MKSLLSFLLLISVIGLLTAEELLPRRFPVSRRKCVVGGKRYFSGQKIDTGDSCKSCFCKFGRTSCRTTRCDDAPFCPSRIKLPNECCSKCECTHEGIMYGDGENWNYRDTSTDKCIQCQCMGDQAFCAPDPSNPKTCGSGLFMKRSTAMDEGEDASELFQ